MINWAKMEKVLFHEEAEFDVIFFYVFLVFIFYGID